MIKGLFVIKVLAVNFLALCQANHFYMLGTDADMELGLNAGSFFYYNKEDINKIL